MDCIVPATAKVVCESFFRMFSKSANLEESTVKDSCLEGSMSVPVANSELLILSEIDSTLPAVISSKIFKLIR